MGAEFGSYQQNRDRLNSNQKQRKEYFLVTYPTLQGTYYGMMCKLIEIATHHKYDEGYNNLPLENLPPNVQYLLRSEDGKQTHLQPDSVETSARDRNFVKPLFQCSPVCSTKSRAILRAGYPNSPWFFHHLYQPHHPY